MVNSREQSKIKYLYALALVFIVIMVSGCARPPIATDLLNPAKNNKPLINNAVTIDTEINSSINNYERIDEGVKKSLELALINANIFGEDSSQPFKIMANIIEASQSPLSFGSFPGRLKVDYILLDEASNVVLTEMIYTEAGSDKWYFSGAERSHRSRAVNISKNVLKFVDILQEKFEKDMGSH